TNRTPQRTGREPVRPAGYGRTSSARTRPAPGVRGPAGRTTGSSARLGAGPAPAAGAAASSMAPGRIPGSAQTEGGRPMVVLRREIGDVLRDARQRQGRTLREVSSAA